MSGPRFFVDADLAVGATITLPPRVAHHARHVLRLREHDAVTLFNGRGGEYAARLLSGANAALVEAFDPIDRESPLAVTLIQALVASEKLDWIVEKTTETGVARILIAPVARSTVKLAGDRLPSRLTRWREIAIAAASQCGRNRPPPVQFFPTLTAALTLAADCDARCIFAPRGAEGLRLARSAKSVAVAIGPEGDWTEQEMEQAERLGYVPALFGPRVLRTETAGVAVIAALQAGAGDLDLRVV